MNPQRRPFWGFPGGKVVKNPPASAEHAARDMVSIPGLGRSPGEGNGNPLQYSSGKSHRQKSLEFHDWSCSHGVTKSQTQLGARVRAHTHRPLWPEHLGKESSKLRCSHVDSKPEGGLEGVTSLHGVLWVQGRCGLWGFFTYVWSLHTCASCDHRLRGAFQVRSLKDTCF